MKLTPLLLLIPLLSGAALADPQCTQADKSKWMNEADAQQKIKAMGYDIKKFKVTETNCYEIYGWDKEKRKVEIYFDPTDLKKVKEEIDE
ncbi:PepSY domain-containing protein [Aeromonas dhakensis]|uniref:PepSY domain-containing protein n=1 Tax=Aeromonas dhakensis TaxID=196024 RepID=UPI000F548837|nr:PepSY domain-containing protein [Aeromonas dhakensis]MCR6740150.1 PepSY domain-containing protein [Aeromonas dhakensis]MDX7694581.1 PepSY domain-containing protein [Aeromonas dhakensis]RQM80025.1 PepSY domain-containing protein [Aeromonas dhakensis]HDX8437196.1 PepSY domain-containing protein [Aeromonas dhakensis]HDX8617225.1 PepSY domain-containing protein [Aeromonas dhakensis]